MRSRGSASYDSRDSMGRRDLMMRSSASLFTRVEGPSGRGEGAESPGSSRAASWALSPPSWVVLVVGGGVVDGEPVMGAKEREAAKAADFANRSFFLAASAASAASNSARSLMYSRNWASVGGAPAVTVWLTGTPAGCTPGVIAGGPPSTGEGPPDVPAPVASWVWSCCWTSWPPVASTRPSPSAFGVGALPIVLENAARGLLPPRPLRVVIL